MGPTWHTRIFRSGFSSVMMFVDWGAGGLSVTIVRFIAAGIGKSVGDGQPVRGPARLAASQACRIAVGLAPAVQLHPAEEKPRPAQRSAGAGRAACRCPP